MCSSLFDQINESLIFLMHFIFNNAKPSHSLIFKSEVVKSLNYIQSLQL